MINFKQQGGQSLIELLIVMAIAAIIFPTLLASFFASRQGKAQQEQRLQAVAYLKEAQEAVRVVREQGWPTLTSFTIGQPYHPSINGNTWTLSPGAEQLNNGTINRKVIINNVYRDGSGAIASSGTLDPSTKQVMFYVWWQTPTPYTMSSTLYLTRYSNLVYTETTKSQFDQGTKTNVITTQTGDGEVQLSTGGAGDWCNPKAKPVLTYNLTRQGIPTSISATYDANSVHTYTTQGYNASGYSLDSQNISDPSPAPGSPSITQGPYYDAWKTYSVFSTPNNVFMTTNHPGVTVDAIQVTHQPFTRIATFNASEDDNGISVTVPSNIGYVTAGDYLFAFNAANLSGQLPELWKVKLAGTGNKVVINGNYAYVATTYNASGRPKGQLQIINLTNHAVVSTLDTQTGQNGEDVFVNVSGTIAYLVTSYTAGKADFFIIDISNPANPVIHATYSTNGMNPKQVVAVPRNHVIIVGYGGNPYQVLTVSSIDSVSYCMPEGSRLSGVNNINAIATISEPDGDNYSYILTDDSSNELQVIQGGAGDSFSESGTFESQTFDASSNVMLNSFSATATVYPAATIKYQIALANAVNNSCTGATFTFVGPDGQTSSYFTTPTGGTIPLIGTDSFVNPGRCLRYRAYFNSTDPNLSAILFDMNINYSP